MKDSLNEDSLRSFNLTHTQLSYLIIDILKTESSKYINRDSGSQQVENTQTQMEYLQN